MLSRGIGKTCYIFFPPDLLILEHCSDFPFSIDRKCELYTCRIDQTMFDLILILCFTTVIIADYPCWAPPSVWGGECKSSRAIMGSCCDEIVYSVEVLGDTNVECQAIGNAYYGAGNPCVFGWHNIGIVNKGSFPLIWSANAAYPGIKCRGHPLGSSLKWNYVVKKGDFKCGSCVCEGNYTKSSLNYTKSSLKLSQPV